LVLLPNPTDYQELPPIVGSGPLQIFGLGTAELKIASPGFSGQVIIRGAQLTLSGNGRLNSIWSIQIENGGTLTLDNSGTAHADRITDWSSIALNAGNLHFIGSSSGSLTEQIGQLIFSKGANTLQLTHHASVSDFTALGMVIFQPEQEATFNLTANKHFGSAGDVDSVRLFVEPIFPFPFTIGDALVMGTVEGEDWVTTTTGSDNNTYFVAFEDYYTAPPNSWGSSHHILLDGGYETVSAWQVEIGSLKLTNGAILDVYATLDFNGLLSTGALPTEIGGFGVLGFQYAHIYNPVLSLTGGTRLNTSQLIKTGPGTLRFAAPWSSQHRANAFTIHQGKVALESGSLQSHRITVGDGSGTDVLELPANRVNPIEGLASSESPTPRRHITLHGTPYGADPDSGEFDAAILRFGGSTVQNFNDFQVKGRGTIDFVGGTSSAPNRLFIEDFYLGDFWSTDFSTTMLFIRNWVDQEDFLLVRRKQANIDRIGSGYLSHIYFEDYGSPGATWVYWSDEYWEIRPFPEPSTYGAIFGVVGLGLFAWRKKRKQYANRLRR